MPLAFGAAVLALLAIAAISVRRRAARRRSQTAPLRIESPEALIAYARALAREAAECDKYVQGQRVGGARGMSESGDHDQPAAAPVATSGRSASGSYTDIGDRVAGVLAAAESAANQIEDDARMSAQEILSAAHEDAERLRREASAYEADTRGAVDSYASDRRREAEQDVQTLLADGEDQARATRQAAEAMARQIEEAGKQRGQALREESRAVEERLKKALTGLRRMAAELEELLGEPVDNGESLVDALKPYGQRDAEQVALATTRSDDA
jgi:hypothetical protein